MNKDTLIKCFSLITYRNNPEYIWKLREKISHRKGILKYILLYKYYKIIEKNCSSIPLNTSFKDMPSFPHGIKGIFVSSGAIIGEKCTIFQHVTIGSNTLKDSKHYGTPVIGDNVYIGAGAKIVGGVRIGNNVRIGANCVVVDDISDNSTVVLPKPRIINCNTIKDNKYYKYFQD